MSSPATHSARRSTWTSASRSRLRRPVLVVAGRGSSGRRRSRPRAPARRARTGSCGGARRRPGTRPGGCAAGGPARDGSRRRGYRPGVRLAYDHVDERPAGPDSRTASDSERSTARPAERYRQPATASGGQRRPPPASPSAAARGARRRPGRRRERAAVPRAGPGRPRDRDARGRRVRRLGDGDRARLVGPRRAPGPDHADGVVAAIVAGSSIVLALGLDWAWSLVQGGVMGPLEYVGERFGIVAPAVDRHRGRRGGAARPLTTRSGRPRGARSVDTVPVARSGPRQLEDGCDANPALAPDRALRPVPRGL